MPRADTLPESVRQQFTDCLTITTLPLQWGDQDALGHVNNVVYFRWFESARIDLLHAFPSSVRLSSDGIGPILASIRCDYRLQLHFPDTVHIGSRVARVGRTSLDVEHRVYSEKLQQDVAEGHSVLVVFDYQQQRPVRIPDDLRRRLQPADGDQGSSDS